MPRIFGEQPREGSNEVPKLILPASGYENKPLTNEEKGAQNRANEETTKKSLDISDKKFAERDRKLDMIDKISKGKQLSSLEYGTAHAEGILGGKKISEGPFKEGPKEVIIGQEKTPSPSPESRPDSVEAKEKFNKEQTEKEIAKLKQEINKEATVRAKRDFAGYNPDGSITLDLEKNFKVFESGEKFREEYLKEVRKKIALDECALSIQKRWEEEFKKKNPGLSEDEMLAKIEEAKKDPKIKTERIKFTQDLEKARKEIRENYGIKIPRGVYYKMIEYGEQIDKLKVSKGKITIPTTNNFENRFDSFEELAEHSKDYGRFFEEGVAERMADEKIEEKLDAKIKTGKERWQEKKREKVAELTNDVNLGKKIEETEDIIPFSEIKKPEIKSTSVLDETPKNPEAEAGDTVVNKKEAGDTSTTLPETKEAEELPQEIEISEESKKMVIKLLRAEAEKLIDSNAAEALALEETVNKLEGNTTGPETRENVVFLLNLLEAGKSAENFEARKELAGNLGGRELGAKAKDITKAEEEKKKIFDETMITNLYKKLCPDEFSQNKWLAKFSLESKKGIISEKEFSNILLNLSGEKDPKTFYALLQAGYKPETIKEDWHSWISGKGTDSKFFNWFSYKKFGDIKNNKLKVAAHVGLSAVLGFIAPPSLLLTAGIIPAISLDFFKQKFHIEKNDGSKKTINEEDYAGFLEKTRSDYETIIKGAVTADEQEIVDAEISKILEEENKRQEIEKAKRELEEKNNPKLVEPVVAPAVAEIPPTLEITPAKTIESLEDKIKKYKKGDTVYYRPNQKAKRAIYKFVEFKDGMVKVENSKKEVFIPIEKFFKMQKPVKAKKKASEV